ncbi:MAG: YetF domain-containing protein [Paraclostridium sp.]
MIVVLIRSIILYIAVLIALRTMGKGEIAEMNAFDLVITLLIAEVAAIPMQNNEIPILYGIASITGLVFMQIIISFFTLKSRKVRFLLNGKPSILIDKGVINYNTLKHERVTLDELLEQLRVQGYFNLKDVQYAILETDGNLSVVPKSTYQNPPTKDFECLPVPLILDGKLLKSNLSHINKDVEWLLGSLRNYGIHSFSDILICILDEHNKLFVQKKQ